jgi:hypothetical protein
LRKLLRRLILNESASSSEKNKPTKSETKMPLTDEELSELWHQAKEQPFRFARLVEQAHGVRSRR